MGVAPSCIGQENRTVNATGYNVGWIATQQCSHTILITADTWLRRQKVPFLLHGNGYGHGVPMASSTYSITKLTLHLGAPQCTRLYTHLLTGRTYQLGCGQAPT